jgi:hypothetical protein
LTKITLNTLAHLDASLIEVSLVHILNFNCTRNKECGPKAKFAELVSKCWHIVIQTIKNFLIKRVFRPRFRNLSSVMVNSQYEWNIINGTWNKLYWIISHMHWIWVLTFFLFSDNLIIRKKSAVFAPKWEIKYTNRVWDIGNDNLWHLS